MVVRHNFGFSGTGVFGENKKLKNLWAKSDIGTSGKNEVNTRSVICAVTEQRRWNFSASIKSIRRTG